MPGLYVMAPSSLGWKWKSPIFGAMLLKPIHLGEMRGELNFVSWGVKSWDIRRNAKSNASSLGLCGCCGTKAWGANMIGTLVGHSVYDGLRFIGHAVNVHVIVESEVTIHRSWDRLIPKTWILYSEKVFTVKAPLFKRQGISSLLFLSLFFF